MDRNPIYPKEDSMNNPNEKNDDDDEAVVVVEVEQVDDVKQQIHYQDELVYYLHRTWLMSPMMDFVWMLSMIVEMFE